VPAQYGRGLEEQSRLAPSRCEARGEHDGQPLPWSPADTTGDLALCDDELLPEEQVLSNQSNTSPNEIGRQPQQNT
jgi:hypothetical protein